MSETVQPYIHEPLKNGSSPDAEPSETFFAKLVGLSEAVSITGKNKGRISLDTNSGKLPFTLNEKAQKRYKIADLFQLYGFKNPNETSLSEVKKPLETTPETALEIALLKQQIEAQAEQIRNRDDQIQDLRRNRDQLLDQNVRFTLLLAAPPAAAPEPTSSPAPAERLPLWKRLFSKS